MTAAKGKIVRMGDSFIKEDERAKSFHLDTYCFDSGSENKLFWDLLRERRVKKLYFTGMLTHGQSDFFIQYIDPDSRTVRSYYPDFIFQREEPDGSMKYVIAEVKMTARWKMPWYEPRKTLRNKSRWPAGWSTKSSLQLTRTSTATRF